MTQLATIERHHQVCDALHQCIMDENRFLRQHQRAPDPALTARKQVLLEQLDESLAALRAEPAASARDATTKAQLEKTRTRILQILQLDKENEQLLLRCSLATARPSGPTPPLTPSSRMLQKIYARCS
jgi:hypothetical protein